MTLSITSLIFAGVASVLAATSVFAGMLAFRVKLKGAKPRRRNSRQAR